jgi:hypothetical protein
MNITWKMDILSILFSQTAKQIIDIGYFDPEEHSRFRKDIIFADNLPDLTKQKYCSLMYHPLHQQYGFRPPKGDPFYDYYVENVQPIYQKLVSPLSVKCVICD